MSDDSRFDRGTLAKRSLFLDRVSDRTSRLQAFRCLPVEPSSISEFLSLLCFPCLDKRAEKILEKSDGGLWCGIVANMEIRSAIISTGRIGNLFHDMPLCGILSY
jgi:hypothetical protein